MRPPTTGTYYVYPDGDHTFEQLAAHFAPTGRSWGPSGADDPNVYEDAWPRSPLRRHDGDDR